METQICIQCKKEKPITAFKLAFDGQNAKNGFNQKQIRKKRCSICYAKRERIKLFIDALNALGWYCSCCGETDIRFLSLDHVQGNGNKHREENNVNCQQVYRLARQEGYPKDKWQILCMNCNTARWRFDGVCPHKLNNKEEYIKEQIEFCDYNPTRSAEFRQIKIDPEEMLKIATENLKKALKAV